MSKPPKDKAKAAKLERQRKMKHALPMLKKVAIQKVSRVSRKHSQHSVERTAKTWRNFMVLRGGGTGSLRRRSRKPFGGYHILS